jgi:phage FluMu protein Com
MSGIIHILFAKWESANYISFRCSRGTKILRITGERNVGVECPKCHKIVEMGCTTYGCPIYSTHDPVNAPKHYRAGETYETIRVIEAWGLGYNLGCCVKYISRCGKKDNHIQDLEKARWYLDREITNLKARKTAHDTLYSRSEKDGV